MKYLSPGQQKILIILAFLLLGILYFKLYHPSPPLPEAVLKEVVVEVEGEVQKPGIYMFQHFPNLKEVIDKAGGLQEPAVFDKDSLSESLETGALLKVQKESNQEVRINIGRMEANKLLVFHIPLDLNRVSAEDLCLIPGIGEPMAREIVTYREKRRGFRSVEELKNVKGIGDKKYESFKTYFIVRP